MNHSPKHSPFAGSHQIPPSRQPRRHFLLEAAAVLIGGFITLVPAAAGAIFFLNPLLRKKKSADGQDDGFRMVGTTSALAPGKVPTMFQVMGVKQDAWTTYPETPLGAVYVRPDGEGKLSCFNAKCPHLGCTVAYRAGEQSYFCPCHDSAFNLDGERTNDIPPRNMDPLEVELRNEREIWVRFTNYRTGISDREPV